MTAWALLVAAVVGAWIASMLRSTLSLDPPAIPNWVVAGLALAFFLGCRLWLWSRASLALAAANARG